MKTLAKEHNFLQMDGTENTWAVIPPSSSGWRQFSTNGAISSTYFDLAGMSMKEKTLFFEASGVQSTSPPATDAGGAAGDSLVVLDVMTSTPLTDNELAIFFSLGNFSGSTITWSETVYARQQVWARTLNEAGLSYMVLLNEEQYGSMSPTASDRVYSYRVVVAAGVLGGPGATSFFVYPARHILRAEAKEEPDHEYIMRLLRSYELQQEPDVD